MRVGELCKLLLWGGCASSIISQSRVHAWSPTLPATKRMIQHNIAYRFVVYSIYYGEVLPFIPSLFKTFIMKGC
jgi:hypothetical protein